MHTYKSHYFKRLLFIVCSHLKKGISKKYFWISSCFCCVIVPNLLSISQMFRRKLLLTLFPWKNNQQFLLVTAGDSLFQIVIIYDSCSLSGLQPLLKKVWLSAKCNAVLCFWNQATTRWLAEKPEKDIIQTIFVHVLFLLLFYQGLQGTNITIKVLCSMMADTSLGEPYARYAAVARLMLETFSFPCLDARFSTYLKDMTDTSWEGPAAGGGVRACVCSGKCRFCVYVGVRKENCGYLTIFCSFNSGYFSVLGNFLFHSVQRSSGALGFCLSLQDGATLLALIFNFQLSVRWLAPQRKSVHHQ